MTTLIKCKFCLRNGSNYVAIPEGMPARCEYCKRVQPVEEKKIETREARETVIVLPSNIWG